MTRPRFFHQTCRHPRSQPFPNPDTTHGTARTDCRETARGGAFGGSGWGGSPSWQSQTGREVLSQGFPTIRWRPDQEVLQIQPNPSLPITITISQPHTFWTNRPSKHAPKSSLPKKDRIEITSVLPPGPRVLPPPAPPGGCHVGRRTDPRRLVRFHPTSRVTSRQRSRSACHARRVRARAGRG